MNSQPSIVVVRVRSGFKQHILYSMKLTLNPQFNCQGSVWLPRGGLVLGERCRRGQGEEGKGRRRTEEGD